MGDDRRKIKGAAYQEVRRALWESEVPLSENELLTLPLFDRYVEPGQAVRRALLDLAEAGEARHREDGYWESAP